MNTKLNTSYVETVGIGSRTLPLLPSEVPSAPNDHIYELPVYAGIRSQIETTSFSPNADVIPRLGTLKSQKNRYIDIKLDPAKTPVPVAAPSQPGQTEGEEFYDKVYDDGYDRPRSIGRGLDGKTEHVQHHLPGWPYVKEESVSSTSAGSESTGTSKITDDGYDRPRSFGRDLRGSTEDVQPKPVWVFNRSAGGSESIQLSKITDDTPAVQVFSGTLPLQRGLRMSGEVATNPLYDPRAQENMMTL